MKRNSDANRRRSPVERSEVTRRQFLARGSAFAMAAAVTGPGLTILSSCGGGGGSSSEPLSFWQFYGPGGDVETQSQWYVDLVDAWNQENETQVELEYIPTQDYIGGTRLQTAFSSGEGPDIFLLSPGDFLRYYNGDALEDLTPYMEQEAIDDFYPEVMATRTVDDKVYALPTEVGALAMYYDVRAFEQSGLSEADIPETWEGLLDVAGRLQTDDRFGVMFETNPGIYQNYTWYPFMWQGGGDAISGNGESGFDSQGAVQALRFWQQTIQEGLAPREALGSGGNDVVANLAGGYCAMQNFSSPGVAALRGNVPDFEYGVFKLPVPPDGEYVTGLGGWAFAANSQGRNPEEAGRFCAWAIGSMGNDSIQRGVRWITEANSMTAPRRSVDEQVTDQGYYQAESMQIFRDDVFPGGRSEPRYPPEVYQPISDALQACQLDDADPEQQAEQVAESVDTFLEGYSGARIR